MYNPRSGQIITNSSRIRKPPLSKKLNLFTARKLTNSKLTATNFLKASKFIMILTFTGTIIIWKPSSMRINERDQKILHWELVIKGRERFIEILSLLLSNKKLTHNDQLCMKDAASKSVSQNPSQSNLLYVLIYCFLLLSNNFSAGYSFKFQEFEISSRTLA